MYSACDIETTGLDFNRNEILGVAVNEKFYEEGEQFAAPESLSFHNGKFDIKFLTKRFGNEWIKRYHFDTLLASSILIDKPASLALDAVAEHYLGVPSWKDETNQLFKRKNWVELLRNDPATYAKVKARAIKDLEVTKQLTTELLARLERENLTSFFFHKIMPAARMLAEVEYLGIGFNDEAATQKLVDINQKIEVLEKELSAWAKTGPHCLSFEILSAKNTSDSYVINKNYRRSNKYAQWSIVREKATFDPAKEINWSSPKQVIRALMAKGIEPLHYDYVKKVRIHSSADPALSQFDDPNVKKLLEHRSLVKLKGYIEGWKEAAYNGRIHCSYNMANTRTGRLSCSEPNLQQVPRDKSVRSLFVPSQGKVFVIADYAQIEPRVVAHYSQDEALQEVFTSKLDFYGSIAVRVLGAACKPNEVKEKFPQLRQVAKVIGLSILYGIGPAKLSDFIKLQTGIEISKDDCKGIIDEYFRSYPGLLEFRKYIERKVYANHTLTTHYGRKFKIDPERVFATGVNTIVQSTASDALLFSQVEINRRLEKAGIKAPVVALIHDEVIREADPKDIDAVKKIMSDVMLNQGFNCPLEVEIAVGDSWAAK